MNTTHRSQRARYGVLACLLAQAVWLAAPARADDWDQAQAAFAELDDRVAFGHLRRAATAGDTRAQLALALALRNGDQLFPGVLQTDAAEAARWRQALGAGPLLPASSVPAKKHTRAALYVNARQAWAMKEAEPSEVVFLDIRSRAEAAYVGMPSSADALVPFREHDDQLAEWDAERHTFSLRPNPEFVQDVARVLKSKGLGKNARVVLICRSGDRSAKAADMLQAQGYGHVHSVVDGFEGDLDGQGRRELNGWKNASLPWSYRLERSKVLPSAP